MDEFWDELNLCREKLSDEEKVHLKELWEDFKRMSEEFGWMPLNQYRFIITPKEDK